MVISLQTEGINERDREAAWKQDAVNLTEEDYVRKHYYDKAESSNSRSPWRCTLDSAQVASLACHSYWPSLRSNYSGDGTECDVATSQSRHNHRRMDNAAPPRHAVEQIYEARR